MMKCAPFIAGLAAGTVMAAAAMTALYPDVSRRMLRDGRRMVRQGKRAVERMF